MKRAAIGVRVHSGWSVLVAVSDHAGSPEIIERKHITIIDPTAAGTKQPYHFAEKLTIPKAEKHISDCAAASERFAVAAIDGTLKELGARGYRIASCALLLASGRALPALPKILASHALIHTAEGEFFRAAVCSAFERLGIRVHGFRERDLNEQAASVWGDTAPQVLQQLSRFGRVIGPPWTADEKNAALAAWMALNRK
ncbi:hypothetical protein [Alloacidobacterium sp.]|uniref:hypothetical protein n=1 Tax=Alloacidobacterium sp. TaxID=2951999 RepID=UPI002D74A5FB|nr:hypothetical protein [Alloacidobacterium sp.]HYK35033.1 hypothetical protein [Alloacidobacterium sp.]